MPRLKGRQSINNLPIALLLVLIAIVLAIPLEYFGITNLITNGKNTDNTQTNNQPIIANETIDKIEHINK